MNITEIMILTLLTKNKFLSRKTIAQELDLGEGVVRSVLEKLKDKNFINSIKSGHSLNFDINKLPKFSKINAGTLTLGTDNFAVLVKNSASKITNGMEQRDAAIKADTLGATTLIYDGNDLYLPADRDLLAKTYPTLVAELKDIFSFEKNDVLIIGTDNNKTNAEKAAWSAVLTLLEIN